MGVPRVDVQYVDKEVPSVRTEAVERSVEVPQVMYEERIVEVPQVQPAEYLREVPKQNVQVVQKQVPRIETQVVERVVPVSTNLIHEVAVEVPQVCVQEVMTTVSKARAEQRIVQTGVEYERNINRNEAVIGVGAAGYAGPYQAPVVSVGQAVNVGPSGTTAVVDSGIVEPGTTFVAPARATTVVSPQYAGGVAHVGGSVRYGNCAPQGIAQQTFF